MITATDIANHALACVNDDPIVDIDEDSDRSRPIKAVWKSVLETFLAEHEWTFARKIDKPARVAVAENDPLPFAHAFAQPEDLVKLIAVAAADAGRIMGARETPKTGACGHTTYRVMHVGDKRRPAICADAETIIIEYTTNRALLDDFSPKAREALALKLALELSLNQKNDSRRGQVLMQRYQAALAGATTADAKGRDLPRLGGHGYSAARLIRPSF